GREALPIELLGRVDEGRRAARWANFLPRVVALAPERRAPGLVQRLDAAIAPLEPRAEGGGRFVAEALGHVAGVLVVDVPHRQCRVVAIALGQPLHQRGGALAIGFAMRAVLLARARPQPRTVGRDRQALWMQPCQPGRR